MAERHPAALGSITLSLLPDGRIAVASRYGERPDASYPPASPSVVLARHIPQLLAEAHEFFALSPWPAAELGRQPPLNNVQERIPMSDDICTRSEFSEALRAHLGLPKAGLMALKFEFGDARTSLVKVHAEYALPKSFVQAHLPMAAPRSEVGATDAQQGAAGPGEVPELVIPFEKSATGGLYVQTA